MFLTTRPFIWNCWIMPHGDINKITKFSAQNHCKGHTNLEWHYIKYWCLQEYCICIKNSTQGWYCAALEAFSWLLALYSGIEDAWSLQSMVVWWLLSQAASRWKIRFYLFCSVVLKLAGRKISWSPWQTPVRVWV